MLIINCDFLKLEIIRLPHLIRIDSIRDGGYYLTKRLVKESFF